MSIASKALYLAVAVGYSLDFLVFVELGSNWNKVSLITLTTALSACGEGQGTQGLRLKLRGGLRTGA